MLPLENLTIRSVVRCLLQLLTSDFQKACVHRRFYNLTHTHTNGGKCCRGHLLFLKSSPVLSLQILTLVLSALPAHPDVLAHTASNLSQEGGGSPASPPTPRLSVPDRAVFTSPPLSLTLPISLSHSLSVFPAHACSDADGSDGVCISVWLAPIPPPPQQAAVCNYRAATG